MFLSLVLIIVITAGGFGLTYRLDNSAAFMWRVAAGNIIGSALFGVACFFLSLLAGFNYFSIIAPALLIFAAVLIVKRKDSAKIFEHDWDKAKGRIERFTFGRVKTLSYYAFFIILFIAFFDRAMIVTDSGIFTGASNNLGDLPFHLGAIFGFSDGNNFPPQNPSFADAKFTYPFVADLLTAVMVKLGAGVKDAMLLQNVTWAFALLVILERFAAAVTKNRLAGKIAPFLLFFSGGLGFAWFMKDYWQGSQGIFDLLWNLPKDYTIGEVFRWGNSMVVLFITQRSILLGMPLALIVLTYLWKIFAGETESSTEKSKTSFSEKQMLFASCLTGVVAGTLPLIHAHSLFVLFVVSAFLMLFSLGKWKEWFAFAGGTAVLSVLLLIWMLVGSASGTSEFIGWHFGFDARGANIVWFWIKNTGLFVPVAFAGLIVISFFRNNDKQTEESDKTSFPVVYFLFAVPFILLFLVSNVVKFAPWEWDNIKVLIYSFVGMIPFAAFAVAYLWENKLVFKVIAGGVFAVLIAAGALDVWRTASFQMEYQVFDRDAVEVAEEIRDRTKPNALFLNAPTYNTAVVLSGRRSLMRYIGHLSSHGIKYQEREADLKKIYAGEATADVMLKKYGIEYVLVSPLETQTLTVNEEYFARKELIIQSGSYRVYKVSSD